MISVVERLIESWLDSQTERRYQPTFIQLLISEGWSVLHNTRHSPIELGKDVIARDPQGVLHCFQLKGNPGGRVTKSEAQTLLPQVLELIELPAPSLYRQDANERHVAVFVTNGTIDEEAMVLFEAAAARTAKTVCPASRFEVITRGHLVARLAKVAGAVWPSTVEGTRQILNFMAEDGRTTPDPKRLSEILEATAPGPDASASRPARSAHLSSLLLIAEIIKAPWYAAANHYALQVMTIVASVHALRFAQDAQSRAAVGAYAALALDHCRDLIQEARAQRFEPDKVWAERDTLGEFDVMWERGRLVGDAAATLLLSGRDLDPEDRDYAVQLVEKTVLTPMLWGLAAVPAYILRYWAACRAGDEVTGSLAVALGALIDATLEQGGRSPLPASYYGFVDVWALNAGLRHMADDTIFEDNFVGRAMYLRAMLQLLARRGDKLACTRIWPDFSKVVHEEPELPDERFFDANLVRGAGKLSTFIFRSKDWAQLVRESQDLTGGLFLEPHKDLAWLIAAYVAIVPYRAWTGVLMWLDHQLAPSPYSPSQLAA